ncbi:hypothetical protein GCM10017673_23080 [Streptosporangium violaceochromogenes]|nr:hypothetical protein GCM10017673_23080 [Streptosporangium violaceochromogenes]
MLALAAEDRIDNWTRSNVADGLLSTVESFVNDVIRNTVRVQDPEQRVLATIAGLEAAKSELAPA